MPFRITFFVVVAALHKQHTHTQKNCFTRSVMLMFVFCAVYVYFFLLEAVLFKSLTERENTTTTRMTLLFFFA